MGRHLVPLNESLLRRLYAEGMPLRELAVHLGVCVHTVRSRVALLGLPRPDLQALRVEAITEAHADLRPDERTPRMIAARTGLPLPVVSRIMREQGLLPPDPAAERGRLCRALREQGLTWRECADAAGYRGRGRAGHARYAAIGAGWSADAP